MSTREQPGYPTSRRTRKGQPLLSQHQAAEQERLRRLQQETNADEVTTNEEEEYDDVWPTRLPTSARRYNAPTDQTTWEYMQGNRKYIFYQGPPPVRQSTQIPSRTQRSAPGRLQPGTTFKRSGALVAHLRYRHVGDVSTVDAWEPAG